MRSTGVSPYRVSDSRPALVSGFKAFQSLTLLDRLPKTAQLARVTRQNTELHDLTLASDLDLE